MAKLKAVLDSLEGLDEGLHDLYVEKDGKFHLDADGVQDVSGLRKSLERLKKEVRDAKSAVPEGFSAERWDELLALDEEAKKGDLSEKQQEAFENLKKQLVDAQDKEKKKLGGRITELEAALRRELVTARATAAIVKHKGSVKLLLPHVERTADVQQADDGRYIPVVKDEQGHVRVDADGSNLSLDALVAELRGMEEFAGAFEGSGATGGGARPSAAGGGSKTTVAAGDNAAFIKNVDKIAKGEVEVQQ